MKRTDVISALSFAMELHRNWATVQRRRRSDGKGALPFVGGETYHRDWAKVYRQAISLIVAK